MIEFIKSIPPWIPLTVIIHLTILGTVAYLILLERKVASWTQDRLGPNRVGPKGLLQPIADGLKFILKEDYAPRGVDKVLFTIAPAMMIIVVIISIAAIPWGGVKESVGRYTVAADVDRDTALQQQLPAGATLAPKVEPKVVETVPAGVDVNNNPQPAKITYEVKYRWPFQIAGLNIGVLFILAVLSLAVYGVVIGGWASNNKYSFLGGLRATAQMISYEIPLAVSALCIVLMFGSLDLGVIVEKQAHYWFGFIPAWNVFCQPLAFLMFLICIHAEANRAPFDLAECEQELVGGFHTEYSSMRFALFFLAEYAGMITTSAVCVALFFGGWHFPGLSGPKDDPSVTASLGIAILRSVVFYAKTIAIIFIFMWVRWSLPRFRFDQLMNLAWRAMIPISLGLLLMTAVVVYAVGPHRYHMQVGKRMLLGLWIGNLVVVALMVLTRKLVPPPPDTNRRIAVPGSRFTNTPLPASANVN